MREKEHAYTHKTRRFFFFSTHHEILYSCFHTHTHTHTCNHIRAHWLQKKKKKSGFPGRTKEGTSSSSVCSLVGVMTSQLVFLAGWCATLPLFLMKRTLNMKAIKGKKRGSSSESKEARGALMKKKRWNTKQKWKVTTQFVQKDLRWLKKVETQ